MKNITDTINAAIERIENEKQRHVSTFNYLNNSYLILHDKLRRELTSESNDVKIFWDGRSTVVKVTIKLKNPKDPDNVNLPIFERHFRGNNGKFVTDGLNNRDGIEVYNTDKHLVAENIASALKEIFLKWCNSL